MRGNWFKDKWNWLKTFNNPPKITINADLLHNSGDYCIEMNNRVVLIVNGTIIDKSKKIIVTNYSTTESRP